MKKVYFFLIICFSYLAGFSQKTVDVEKDEVNISGVFYTLGGEPFVNTKFVRLTEGSPYFNDDWITGALILEKNGRYKGSLKLDLYSNEIHYKDVKGNDFVVTLPVKKIVLSQGDTTLIFLHSSLLPQSTVSSNIDWFIPLYSDSVSLYKYFIKELSENKPYGSATYEQKIRTIEMYRVYYNGAPVDIKKLKDAPALFGNKKAALNEFLKTKDDKKNSMDNRMIAFVMYLNSLVKQ